MANRLSMSPELSQAVERARVGAREAGQLLDPPAERPRSSYPAEVRTALADWRASGEFDRDVAAVSAGDPDLETQ